MEDQELFTLMMALLTLFNPAGAMGPFMALAGRAPERIQHGMARQVALSYGLVLATAAVGGRALLQLMGISLPALQLTGGFVLLMAALPMVLRPTSTRRATDAEVREEIPEHDRSWRALAAVPLTFPLSLGGATLAVVITAAGQPKPYNRSVSTAAVCLAMSVVVYVTFRYAPRLLRRLGSGGIELLTVLGGTVLLCIGFQALTAGLRGLLPGLAR